MPDFTIVAIPGGHLFRFAGDPDCFCLKDTVRLWKHRQAFPGGTTAECGSCGAEWTWQPDVEAAS